MYSRGAHSNHKEQPIVFSNRSNVNMYIVIGICTSHKSKGPVHSSLGGCTQATFT